jgi:hypothetical protein
MWEMTPHSGGYYHTTVSYLSNGVINALSGIPGYTPYTFGVDGEGRANTAIQGSKSIVSGVTFNPSSKPLVVSAQERTKRRASVRAMPLSLLLSGAP